MRKSPAFLLLAAIPFLAVPGSSLCFAADAVTPQVAAAPNAPTQPSGREMHRIQQTNIEEKRLSDAEQSQTKDDAQTEQNSAPNPSQRSMRRQIREAEKNQAGETGSH